ncbi:hypothetical protein BDV32DRAFT_17253 [Aspergillus pseudonomiae]|uniref:Uncharacterized protein n=1 Tax=Aspergillus pseudonomiae TaxID=1506151 RepID=A0A5N7DUA0_9EURO|nr:uncharacterized protein BDV37DRAFT_236334 [Aspergillus pseudonomiae]KAB8262668.1 hypothetical protein BDV32DRAFT_17253 [Aspergillus pseudonomiae]KAE8409589.1 hypothetical protein BDV37DRAFT_236334 [Aspergillus pseudonomiae]
MSFGRHAYRHAVPPSSHSLVDHVWISEDFLASTFRRFANGQRRYESRVPGPLEARRRLAKRRNTALASLVGSGPLDDIGCLFGRNGREHMKWVGGQSRNAPREAQGSAFYAMGAPAYPLPFYNETTESNELSRSSGWQGSSYLADKASLEQCLAESLKDCQTITAIKDVVRKLRIDLQQEPAYSRLIFEHLLSQSINHTCATDGLIEFLDDPHLNTRGAGNYLCTVEHFVSRGADLSKRSVLLGNVTTALELGRVPENELCQIIRVLFERVIGDDVVRQRDARILTAYYRRMWDAIGRCNIYEYENLDTETIETWLEGLEKMDMYDSFILARDIISATQDRSWAPLFITRFLKFSLDHKTDGDYISGLLNCFTPDEASLCIISVTELLAASRKQHLFEMWQDHLRRLQNIPGLVSSSAWSDMPVTTSLSTSCLTQEQRIILRLWVLRTFSEYLPEGPLWRHVVRATDYPVSRLLSLYKSRVDNFNAESFLSSLVGGIHDLGIPPSGLLMLSVHLTTGKRMTKATRRTLNRLESSNVSLLDIFANGDAYRKTVPHLFSDFERLVRQINVTSPSFLENSIQIASTGDSQNVWTLIRLLRCHTPLKIALSRSWGPVPDASQKALVRYYPEARTSECPDPHAALDMVHLIAISIASSKQLSARRAYGLIQWLYRFLVKHGAPVKPSLVRAMYHVGVVRYRREGLRLSSMQYAYILDLVEEVEGPEVLDIMVPRVGQSDSYASQLELQ